MYVPCTGVRQRGDARPLLPLLLLLGLPTQATVTLAACAVVCTADSMVLDNLLPEPVRGNGRGPPHLSALLTAQPVSSCALGTRHSGREWELRWRHSKQSYSLPATTFICLAVLERSVLADLPRYAVSFKDCAWYLFLFSNRDAV